ncbi:MAG TPA: tetratricopeptide repeat protein [Terriglobia bacterium]|nr:tetratricopeptide repeat protein [Terriglobia bacterium]
MEYRKQRGLALSFLAGFLLLCNTPSFPQTVTRPGAAPALPAAAQASFKKARSLLQQGNFNAALTEVREGLRLAPHSVMGLNLLGIILGGEGNQAEALAAFQSALRLAPDSTETHNNLGDLYVQERQPGLAEAQFQASLRLDSRNRDANYNLGSILLSRHDARRAIQYLERIHPPDAATSFRLVQAYFAAGENSKALSTAQALSAQAPQDLKVHFSLGVLLASERQFQPAIHELELADALKPGTFEILHNLGGAYLRAREDAKAEATLERAQALKPDSVNTLYLEAQAYTHQKNYLKAFQLLFRARQFDPKNTDIVFLLARLSMMQDYFEDAIPLLEDGLKIAPNRPDLHAALGESYFSAGNLDKAYEQFRILLRLDPSAPSYGFMGLYYRRKGQFDEAKKEFSLGLQKDAHNLECLYNLGYIADKQGDFRAAENYLQQVLKLNPDFNDALFELSSVETEQKRFGEAVPLLQHYVRLNPNQSKGYYKLAIAERSLHQMQASQTDFKIFETLAKNPQSGPMPFQHFLEGVSEKVSLPPQEQAQADLRDLDQQMKQHPDRPKYLYLLAETYLKLGQLPAARENLARLRQVSGGDVRTLMGEGVLLARYKLFADAIQYFQAAVAGDSGSDDAKYDLADAYFEMGDYPHALEWLQKISSQGRNQASYLALWGDTEGHLGRFPEAESIFNKAIQQSPDEDSYYLSLALIELRAGDSAGAGQTLKHGEDRIPDSGEILWGQGVLAVVQGDNKKAQDYFERAQDLLPEWESSYSALGTFYFETGQFSKAQETLNRYAKLFPNGGLNVDKLRQVLATYNRRAAQEPQPLSPQERTQFLAMALVLAERNP